MTKTCNVCGIEKALTEFPKNGNDKYGNTRYRADCKECYNINRRLSRKQMSRFLDNTKRRTGEENDYTFQDWKNVVTHFRGSCAYCGRKQSRKVKLTKDHVIPVSKGGRTVKENIIPACEDCNSSKSDSDMDEWFMKQEFYNDGRKEKIDRWLEKTVQRL